MKYYILKSSNNVNGIVPSGLDGIHVSNKDDFFANGKCGPDKFYDHDYQFDYLIPHEFGDDYAEPKTSTLFDLHQWHGVYPIGGWLQPISQRFKFLLEQFNLLDHRFYSATVLFNSEVYPYFVMQVFINSYQKLLDFEKTTFNNLSSTRNLGDRILDVKKFDSIDQVKSYAKEIWGSPAYWNYERVVMRPDFKNVDFITMFKFGDLVSERLKNAIEDEGLTGIEFKELPIPIEFSDEI